MVSSPVNGRLIGNRSRECLDGLVRGLGGVYFIESSQSSLGWGSTTSNPLPPLMSRDVFNQIRLHRALSNLAWKVSSKGIYKVSSKGIFNQFQCFNTEIVKTFFPNM